MYSVVASRPAPRSTTALRVLSARVMRYTPAGMKSAPLSTAVALSAFSNASVSSVTLSPLAPKWSLTSATTGTSGIGASPAA